MKCQPTKSRDLLPVLDQLHAHALSDGAVRLLGLDADFLKDDPLGVGGSLERGGFEDCSQVALLVLDVCPSVLTSLGA